MASEPRSQIVRILEQQGFRVSPGLPEPERTRLRPLIEIATRLVAVKVVGHWVASSEEHAPAELLRREVERLGLRSYLDEEQRDMLATERTVARRLFLGGVGWAFEGV
jgi:hypothetical protein